MKRKQPSRKDLLSSCGEVGADDGIDPRLFFRKLPKKRRSPKGLQWCGEPEKKLHRKTLQLCSEVAKTLGQVQAWELGDDLLGQLQVESVVPAPNSMRLLVTVSVQTTSATHSATEILQRLWQYTGRLRKEIASAIHRRRVPDLVFRLELRKEEKR